jgi:Na+/H+ antiporter NhaD/arsenite permease-like protein
MIFVLIGFLLTYASILAFPQFKVWLSLGAASIFLLLGVTQVGDVFSSAMNWNVFMIIGGTMLVVSEFIRSKMPALIADFLMTRVSSVKWAIILLAAFSGIVSAFVDNVATVLIVAPIAMDIAKRTKISPVPLVIAVSVFANIQGFATLVGDTTSVMLAGNQFANMNFFDFFFTDGQIGPFFIVQLGTLVALIMLYLILGKHHEPIRLSTKTTVTDYAPSVFLLLILGALITASFIPNTPADINGYLTLGIAILFVVCRLLTTSQRRKVFSQTLSAIDVDTLGFLFGLFILIIGLDNQGVIDAIGLQLETLGGNNPFVIYTLIVFVSVVFSAFIDNIPYVATLLPVMMRVGVALNLPVPPYVLLFGLLAGATLGGNLTPIGASANVAGIGLLKKQGFKVSFMDFFKVGFPITMAALLIGYLMIWFIYGPI